jgi:hypothetical protein
MSGARSPYPFVDKHVSSLLTNKSFKKSFRGCFAARRQSACKINKNNFFKKISKFYPALVFSSCFDGKKRRGITYLESNALWQFLLRLHITKEINWRPSALRLVPRPGKPRRRSFINRLWGWMPLISRLWYSEASSEAALSRFRSLWKVPAYSLKQFSHRVARFFLVQHTKTGKYTKYPSQVTTKYTLK